MSEKKKMLTAGVSTVVIMLLLAGIVKLFGAAGIFTLICLAFVFFVICLYIGC